MFNYILRRMLLLPITLFGITLLVFLVMAASPADPVEMMMPKDGDTRTVDRKAIRDATIRKYGLDQNLAVRYVRWLNLISPIGFEADSRSGEIIGSSFGFKTPDLGDSILQKRPVLELIADAVPITILFNLSTVPIMYFIAINLGVFSAKHRGQLPDVVIGSTTMALWAIPVIWVAVMLQGFFASKEFWHIFEPSGMHDAASNEMTYLPSFNNMGKFEKGYLLDLGYHMILPLICLSFSSLAFLTKLTRSAMLENLSMDFVRTAKAKGVDSKTILYSHVFRNSLLPLITAASTILPGLLAGSIIVETIFDIPGMGQLTVGAAKNGDSPLVLGVTLVSGILGLISYIIADIGYAIADPRVSYE